MENTKVIFGGAARHKGRKGIPRCSGKSAAKIARYWNSGKPRRRKIRTLTREIGKLERNAEKNAKGLVILRERLAHRRTAV